MDALLLTEKIIQFAPIVTIVSSSAVTIYNMIDIIKSKQNTIAILNREIYDFFDKSDVQIKVSTYGSLLAEIKHSDSPTILQCISNIKDTLGLIELQLHKISEKMNYNQNLWIGVNFRSYSLDENIKELEKLIIKLDARVNMLRISYELISIAR